MGKKLTRILAILSLILAAFFTWYSQKNGQQLMLPTIEIPTNNLTSPLSISELRTKPITGSKIVIEEELEPGANYKQYLASYQSEGNKIFALLTIPTEKMPKGGFPAVVFNHGYIPPKEYRTTERYGAYVDSLARSGLVIFKIDMRGHGLSEGTATGSYFSPGYTIDALSALKSLQKLPEVNPKRIGMWGHSMAGNLLLRALEISPEIKAGVIWAGAVYSYKDFARYRLSDSSYRPRTTPIINPNEDTQLAKEIRKIRASEEIDFESQFWREVSLTKNLNYLKAPLQIHHAVNDETVNVGYSRDLVTALKKANKKHEYFEYEAGGHNLEYPVFDLAMERTIAFFLKHL